MDFVVAPDGTVYYSADSGLGARAPDGSIVFDNRRTSYGIALSPAGKVRWGSNTETPHSICRYTNEVFGSSGLFCTGFMGVGRVTGLTLGPDGNLWAAFHDLDRIVATDTDLLSNHVSVTLPAGSSPARIAVGPDGNMWVTEFDASAIDRITLAGTVIRFPLPAGSKPNDIVAGPDGALWFTELGSSKIGRMTTDGVLTNEYPTPSPNSNPIGLTVAADGAIWFTESTTGKVGRLVPDPTPSLPGGSPTPTTKPLLPPVAPPDTTAPRFSSLPVFAPPRFAVGAQATALSSRAGKHAGPLGSKLQLALSEPATVTVAIARSAPGRKLGRRCVAPTKSNKTAAKCTRHLSAGSLQRKLPQGASTVPFSGRLGAKPLTPGSYLATLSAKDGAGNDSLPATAGFTILAAVR